MDIYTTIIVEDKEANLDEYIQMRRFKHQEVFILILKYKLIYKWIFLKTLKSLLKFLHVEMATPITENFERCISEGLVITEYEIT